MLERSDQAPPSWTQEHAQAAIREFALRVEPDILLFQELPRMVPYVETHGMMPGNPVTHSGNLATLLTHRLMDSARPQARVVEGTALLAVLPPLEITVANVHLTPGPGAADRRLAQMERIVDATDTKHLLIIGDTNSRLAEAADYRGLGLHGEKPPAPTWNSRRNRFHGGLPEFSAYFTRWFASQGVAVEEIRVWDDARVEHDGSRFELSDHYALSGTVRWTPSQ